MTESAKSKCDFHIEIRKIISGLIGSSSILIHEKILCEFNYHIVDYCHLKSRHQNVDKLRGQNLVFEICVSFLHYLKIRKLNSPYLILLKVDCKNCRITLFLA